MAQGKVDEAEHAQKQSLAIQEKVLGPEHPDVAASLNNLARLLLTRVRTIVFNNISRTVCATCSSPVGRLPKECV